VKSQTCPPDETILSLLRAGKEQGMELLFQKYYAHVCLIIVRIVANPHTAEDLAQDVFSNIWQQRTQLQIHTGLKAYLSRAARNRALNHLRDQKIHWEHSSELAEPQALIPTAQQTLESQELQNLIDQAIDALPERCRIVFVLKRFEHLSHQEIAHTLGISTKTVENHMTKALKMLQAFLSPWIEPHDL